MSALLMGLLLGFAYAAPIGAQNLFVISSAMDRGIPKAYVPALFVALNDIALAAVCFWGLGTALSGNAELKIVLMAFGAIILVKLSIDLFKTAADAKNKTRNTSTVSLMKVLAMSAALTWLNPQALLDGSLILGASHASLASDHRITFFVGAAMASFLWFFGITTIVGLLQETKVRRYFPYINYACAGLLLIFAVRLGVGALSESKALASENVTIKVAVLDNLRSEKLASEKYVGDYFQGIDLATQEAIPDGIRFEVKDFLFGKQPLEVLEKAKEASLWKPDVVIAPRFSDLFLHLKSEFKNTLVVSPLATANKVAAMPENFYSITPNNRAVISTFTSFVKERFPKRPIYQIVQSDCENCRDFAATFVADSKNKGLVIRNDTAAEYLSTSVETVKVDKLLENYVRGDLILLPNSSYSSGVLMGKIAEHLRQNNLVFLGGDGWGDWAVGYAGKFKSPYSYEAFRIVPWSLKKTDKATTDFHSLFMKHNGTDPHSAISFVTYSTTKMIANLALSGLKQNGKVNRETLLKEFIAARKLQGDFARPDSLAIMKISQDGEDFVGMQTLSSKSKRALSDKSEAKK